MGEVKRRKGETFDALLRRFQRHVQTSGKLLQAKKIRFKNKPMNRNKRRTSALYREEKRQNYEYLLKTGQLKDEPQHKRR
ncbi:30S ribosomal protein S21 [Candidatus Uhrbacteria bacterium]|nr:30S ribosomal protein S21 [Candidatus Uhrbacteria bacterium]